MSDNCIDTYYFIICTVTSIMNVKRTRTHFSGTLCIDSPAEQEE